MLRSTRESRARLTLADPFAAARGRGVLVLTELTGTVFDVQRYSTRDGPGIRTTVFLKGCPASCAWCHNPESRSPRLEVIVLERRCVGCGSCLAACPHGILTAPGDRPAADDPSCSRCGECVEACPTGARQFVGRRATVPELVTELLRDRPFFEESGGGVTISGGEPFSQASFLMALLSALRREGLHVAVDTSGAAPRARVLEAASLANLFLFDLKHMDDARHRELTGVSNEGVLENLRALGRAGARIWVRVPLIPGMNDDRENLAATARFTLEVPGVERVSVLPYHRTGARKFARVGAEYHLAELEPPSLERAEEAARPFRALGLETVVGG